MPFGERVGTIKKLKEGLKSSSEGFITYVPPEKTGPIYVRFLEEPTHWAKYQEVWDEARSMSYPVPPSEDMPGYPAPDDQVRTKYLANAIKIADDGKEEKQIVIQMAKSLVNQLVVRYERYETLLDRDYELFRTGSGLDTEYGQSPEAPRKRNLTKYKPKDLEAVLEAAYAYAWGEDEEVEVEDEETENKVTSGRSRRTARPAEAAKKVSKAAVKATRRQSADMEPTELAALADENDDEQAIEKLTLMADERDLDVNDYPTWAEVAEALEGFGEDPEEEADADDAEEDLNVLAEAADAEDDADAQERLTALADEAGIDTNDYATWVEVVEALDGGTEDEGLSEDDLQAMSLADLRKLARGMGIVTRNVEKEDLIEQVLSA